MPPKLDRPLSELVAALQRHVRLLREYADRAFAQRDMDFLGELATKLRLLVWEGRQNRALLLNLMDVFKVDIPITLGGPPQIKREGEKGPGDKVSLREFMTLPACGVRTPSQGFVMLNKLELVRALAEQHGAAHEDWALDEKLAAIIHSGIDIGGLPAAAAELRTTVDAVLYVADSFLSGLTSELIAQRQAEIGCDN